MLAFETAFWRSNDVIRNEAIKQIMEVEKTIIVTMKTKRLHYLQSIYGIIRNTDPEANALKTETRLMFYIVVAVPIFFHGSETSRLTKVQTAHMKFLRSVKGYVIE